jgi:hypothetical protein
MVCLLCGESYPETQIECMDCNNNLQSIRPYSPHLSQIIRMGEKVAANSFNLEVFQMAVKNLLKRLEIATEDHFKYEAELSQDDIKIFEDYLNSLLEHSEFFKKSLEEMINLKKDYEVKKLYSALDKARIYENMFLKSLKKFKDLKEEDIKKIAQEKGIKI